MPGKSCWSKGLEVGKVILETSALSSSYPTSIANAYYHLGLILLFFLDSSENVCGYV